MDEEEWRPLPGSFMYQISSLGRVHHDYPGGRYHEAQPVQGEMTVYLESLDSSTRVPHSLPRLMAEAFLPDPPSPESTVVYIDGDFTNCRADNLRWSDL